MSHKAIPELSVDTQVLERRLLELNIGDEVPYQVLSTAIGRNVQGPGRHVLASAVRRLLNEHGRVIASVKGQGMKRLDDVGIVSTGAAAIKHIHRTSKRASKRLAAVADYEALPKPEQARLNLQRAMLGVLAHSTREPQMKKLEGKVGAALVPSAKMLDAMRESL